MKRAKGRTLEASKQRFMRESNPRILSRTKSNPGSNRRPLLSQPSLKRSATLGRSTARSQNKLIALPNPRRPTSSKEFGKTRRYENNKPQSSSNYRNTPLNSFANTKRNTVNSAQRSLHNNMKILRNDVGRALKLHGQWQLEVDQFTNDKKTKYMQELPNKYISGLSSLINNTKKVYSAGSTFGKPAQVTVFDYDDNYHILSVNLLRALSLWYSTLSFMTDDKSIAMGRQLRPLVKDVHTLFVLSTSTNYFGTEVAVYLQNPRSDWKARLERDTTKYSEIQKNKYKPFLSVDVIKRFEVK
jgi:hypothetical protein